MKGLHNLKGSQVIKALERLGWSVARDESRHTIMKKPGRPGIIPVPRHRVIGSGTLREMLKEAGVSWADFSKVYW